MKCETCSSLHVTTLLGKAGCKQPDLEPSCLNLMHVAITYSVQLEEFVVAVLQMGRFKGRNMQNLPCDTLLDTRLSHAARCKWAPCLSYLLSRISCSIATGIEMALVANCP